MYKWIIGLIIKGVFLLIMVGGVINCYFTHPDSAAGFVLLSLICLFAVLEHIFNPFDNLTGEYKII